MLGGDLAAFGRGAKSPGAHAQLTCRLREVHPGRGVALIVAVAGDPVVATQGRHAFLRPAIAAPGEQAVAIEEAGD